MNYGITMRVTGIVILDENILLVKQKYEDREWSLPGGRLESGEGIEEAILREMKEETGYSVEIDKLLYVADRYEDSSTLIHMTFLLNVIGGALENPTNEFDQNPISEVKWVPIQSLETYGFSNKFMKTVQNNFPNSGNYIGAKSNIGL